MKKIKLTLYSDKLIYINIDKISHYRDSENDDGSIIGLQSDLLFNVKESCNYISNAISFVIEELDKRQDELDKRNKLIRMEEMNELVSKIKPIKLDSDYSERGDLILFIDKHGIERKFYYYKCVRPSYSIIGDSVLEYDYALGILRLTFPEDIVFDEDLEMLNIISDNDKLYYEQEQETINRYRNISCSSHYSFIETKYCFLFKVNLSEWKNIYKQSRRILTIGVLTELS